MLAQAVDALGQQCNLNLGGAGVLRAALELADDAALFFTSKWHEIKPQSITYDTLRRRALYASRAPLSSSIRGRGNEAQRLQPPGRLDRAQAHETEPRSVNTHVSSAFPGHRNAAALANRFDTLGRHIEPPPITECRIDRQQQPSAFARRKSLQSLEGPLRRMRERGNAETAQTDQVADGRKTQRQ